MEIIRGQLKCKTNIATSQFEDQRLFYILIFSALLIFFPLFSVAQTGETDSGKKLLSRFLLLKTDNAFTEKAIRSDAQRFFDLLVIAYPELPSEAFQIVIEETRLSNSKFLDRKIDI